MNELRTKFIETCDYLLDNFRINPGSIYDSWGNLSAESLDRYVSPFVANVSDIVRWKEKGMNSLTIPCVVFEREAREFQSFHFFMFLLCHSNYKNITRIAHSYHLRK